MTDTGVLAPKKKTVGRGARRSSFWPIVIVVVVPLLSVALGLNLMVTALLLLVGTALLMLSPHVSGGHIRDPKMAWVQLLACYTRLQSAHTALQQSPADAGARKRFMNLLDECESLLRSRPSADWGSDAEYVPKVRSDVEALAASIPDVTVRPEPEAGSELGPLSDLRMQGLISESEFRAFSARLCTMAADRLWDVLDKISGLRSRCGEGTLTQADFHAALQRLLDRLDEPDGGVARGLLPQRQDAPSLDAGPDAAGAPGVRV